MSEYKYRISVIIPVYNLEKYIEEAITSVVDQVLGFRNIQLILVDDGSSDGSIEICQRFADEYSNVTLIQNEHRGVSHARNTGLKLAEGEYINFFDGDDIWGVKALKRAIDFMDSHPEVDVGSGRLRFFEAKTGYTKNDFRFGKGNRVIDIHEEPQSVQLGVCSSIFRAEAIRGMEFDERLEIGEDAKFINTVILKKEKYAALRYVMYNVRKRADNSSAVQVKRYSLGRITNTVDLYLKYFCDLSEEKYGKIIPYIQYLVMNSVRNRTMEQLPEDIPSDIKEDYVRKLYDIVRRMDDETLVDIKNTPFYNKLFMLRLKHGDELEKHIKVRNGVIRFDKKQLADLKKLKLATIEDIDFDKSSTTVTGILRGTPYYKASLSCKADEIKLKEAPEAASLSVDGQPMDKKYRFAVTLPAGDSDLAFKDEKNGIIPLKYKLEDPSVLSVGGEINLQERSMYVSSDSKGLHFRKDTLIKKLKRSLKATGLFGSRETQTDNKLAPLTPEQAKKAKKKKKKKTTTRTKDGWVKVIAKNNGWTEEKTRDYLDHMKDYFDFKPKELEEKDLNNISQTALIVQILLDRRKKLRKDACYAYIRQFSGKTRKKVKADLKAIRPIAKAADRNVYFKQYYRYNGYSLDTTDTNATAQWVDKLGKLTDMGSQLAEMAAENGYTEALAAKIEEFRPLMKELLSEGKKAQNYSFIKEVRPDVAEGTDAYDDLMTDIEITNAILGFRADEYAIYHFWNKPFSERMKYITDKKRSEILLGFNSQEGIDILNDKYRTYERAGDLYGRKVTLLCPPDGYNTFLEFTENHSEFVKKSNYDSLGRGVEKITIDSDTDLKSLYNDITADGKYIILEELIKPHDIIRNLNPSSVNTVRVTTFLKDGKATVQDSFMKIGRNGSFVDNGGAGGIFVHVDKDSGMTDSHGIIETGVTFEEHPDHGYTFCGIQLPKWEEARELVCEAATRVPEARYIGWDITHTAEGKWIIVEGNAKTQFFGQQSTVGIGKLDQLMALVE